MIHIYTTVVVGVLCGGDGGAGCRDRAESQVVEEENVWGTGVRAVILWSERVWCSVVVVVVVVVVVSVQGEDG